MRHVFAAILAMSPAFALAAPPDLSKQPTLYVVGYAHLDTQWRWEFPRTIGEFLPRTMHDNFVLFEKYPHYIFNFSGANRYRLMKEYYPADYEKMKQYVQSGRWFVAGSAMEESDVNTPSAESLIRQVLYGTHYFRREFGRTSAEYMLPDCFGFPSSLPSILAHMGIKGFSTQKLTWHSSAPVGGESSPEKTPVGIPFNVGVWEGPDGHGVIAALNPGDYSGDVTYDISKSEPPPNARNFVDWPARVRRNGTVSGVFADYHYYGTGDVGGAPREASVSRIETIVTESNPALHVISSTAEQMFLDITPAERHRLPRYSGDLELIEHSAGSLTSQTVHKRWNRKNEMLGDAAEKASVAAQWLGARSYPLARLNDAWTLVMGGQFHDTQAGTATPKAYEYAWNDDVLAMNQFAAVLTSAMEGVAAALDTRVQGTPVIVYNPLNIEREDIVEASIYGNPEAVRVIAPDGREVLSQVSGGKVVFLARVPSVGYAVYDVRRRDAGALSGENQNAPLENERYRIRVDDNGDLASIYDKKLGKEILAAPARLALQTEAPHDWPAWNMDWADQQKPPRAYVQGPATVRIVERGPARVAVEIAREAEGSKFVQTIRLVKGSERIEIDNAIDWHTPSAALKATFPLTASNPRATYNWEVGTIERGNNEEKKYEVPTHQWFDLTDKTGAYGVTILSDCKYGSDKPADDLLRLTLLYTPGLGAGNGRAYSDQTSQDWGHHHFVYGIASHAGDWRREETDWQALRLNQPLIAFSATKHAGALGKTFSLVKVDNSRVRVMAVKKAEESDDIIVRVVELNGKPGRDVHLHFAGTVRSAREVNGQELPIGRATIKNGELVTNLTPYELRAFAVKLAPREAEARKPRFVPLQIAGTKAAAFDSSGRTLATEMLPEVIDYAGIQFHVNRDGIVPHGESIRLSANARRVYVLAAADGDQNVEFGFGKRSAQVTIEDWTGYVGQWDNRTWIKKEVEVPPRADAPPGAPPRKRTALEFTGINPGFIKRDPVAWFASHRHAADGSNEPYAYSYLFAYEFQVSSNDKTLTLPNNDHIRILAITTSDETSDLVPAQPLYDTLQR